MSLVRRGKHSYLTHNRQKKKKSASKKRPAWDDSLTDLTSYRANADDLEYRKAVHQSKHLPSVKFQREKKAAQKDEILSTLGKLNPKQLAIMKEILYNQDELQTVLNYSDRLMDNVKDVCGDNPKRYHAFPSVTSAPGSDADAFFKNNLPSELPEYQSRLDLLSNKVMSSVALNDEQEDPDEGSQATSTYTSQIDMERFRKLLAAEEENLKNACATPNQHDIFAKIQTDSDSDLNTTTPDTSVFGAPTSAVNDTKKVNRVRKIIAEDPIQSGTQVVLDGTVPAGLSLSDLKKVLEELQSEMELYEQNTGRIAAEKEHRETFSGYTMALLSSVIKLSRYLRETEEKLQAGKKTQDVLAAEVSDLKIIVDALTSDLIQTQEMYQNLESELRNYQQRMDQEICFLKRQAGLPLSDCCKEENVSPASSSLAAAAFPSLPQTLIPPPHLSTTNKYEMEARNMIRKTKSLEPEKSENHPGLILNKQIEPFFPVFQSAFQLSPPVQKTRVFTQNGTGQQLSLVGIEELALNTPSHVGQAQKVPSIQASVHQALPKQHVTDIVIPKPIQLGQSQNLSASVPNSSPQGIINCQSNDVENVQFHSEPTEEFGDNTDSNNGNEEMSRSVMLTQIEELNKQHQQAERLLKMLLQSDQQLGAGVSPGLAPEELRSELSHEIHIEQPDSMKQDHLLSVSDANSTSIGKFPQDQVSSPQSQEFSIAV